MSEKNASAWIARLPDVQKRLPADLDIAVRASGKSFEQRRERQPEPTQLSPSDPRYVDYHGRP